ncbi:MAG: DUF465 domain-containing protein [Deltaproteobacteria bacterium]|nr:DUF465 domain-containing protein [Deltaproteobacteria bacterium]
MKTLDGDFLKRLLERDVEFRKIYEAHRECEKRAAKLSKKVYVTREEEIEEKRLKKLKLEQKDKMAEVVSKYREARE